MKRVRPTFQTLSYLALLMAALLQTTLASSGKWLFAMAIAVAVVNIIRRIQQRDPLPTLATMWEVGFVTIVAVEGFLEESTFVRDYGVDAYRLASVFLVGGLSIVMIGHAMTFRPYPPAKTAWLSKKTVSRSNSVAFIAMLSVLFILIAGPNALALVEIGRWGTATDSLSVSAFGSLTSAASRGAAIVLPAMIGYHVLMLRRGSVRTAYLVAAPVLFINFAIGTRFVFFISVVGIIVVHVLATSPTRTQLLKLAATGVLLALALSAMAQFRGEGLLNANPADVLAKAASPSALRGENVIGVMSELVLYFDENPHLLGKSSLGLAVFWVPRQIWPSKPTMLGYWFPRAIGGTGFVVGHSVSAGFGGDAYADLGFWGGLLLLLGWGLFLGVLDRWASQELAARNDPWVIFVATLYGFVFFAVRSPVTSIIVAAGVLAWVVGYAWIIRVGSVEQRILRPGQPDEQRAGV